MSETTPERCECGGPAICADYERHLPNCSVMALLDQIQQLEADSKKLREPATCNAGHKSNLPLALWDCPVCTQLLRDKLKGLDELVGMILHSGWRFTDHGAEIHIPGNQFKFLIAQASKIEAVLRGEQKPDLEAHERDMERRAGCGDE